MSISTMKLSRITLDSLKNLEQDPTAVEKAVDAYQGRIRGDRSTGDNIRRQAESLQNLFDTITTEVPKAVGTLSKAGEQEAYDEWQQASPEQQETWRKAVKNDEVGPWHSPFFNRGMEKMVANDHVLKYGSAYAVNYANARTSGDKKFLDDQGQFDLVKFNETTLKEYQEENGLLNMSGQAYSIFARGTGPIHAEATAKNAEAKAALIMGNHKEVFGSTVLNLVNTLSPKEFGKKTSQLLQDEVIAMGLDPKKYRTQIEAVIESAYIDRVKAGVANADDVIEAWGEMSTGSGTQKFKDLPLFKTKEALLHAAGANAAKEHEEMVEWKRERVDKAQITKGQDDWGKYQGTGQQFLKENPDLLALMDKWEHSSISHRKQFAAQLRGIRFGGIDSAAVQDMMPELVKLPLEEARDKFMSYNPKPDQVKAFEANYANNQIAKTGRSGVAYTALQKKWFGSTFENQTNYRGGGIPNAINDVPLDIRVLWNISLDEERQRALTAAINNVDTTLSPEDQRAALSEEVDAVNSIYDVGMQAKYDEFVTEKTVEQEKAQKDAAVARARFEYLEGMGDDGISDFMRGSDNRAHELLQKTIRQTLPAEGEEPTPFHTQALIDADNALVKTYRFKQAAESLGLKPTHENIDAVSEQIKLMLSDIYGPDGPDKTEEVTPEQKKEMQETMWQGIKGVLTNTTDSLLNLTPEFIEEGVNDGLDGIQSIVESLPENTLGVIKTMSDAVTKGKDALNISDAADAVGDALLGKQAHAAAVVDNPTEGVMQSPTESNTGVSQLRNVRNNNPGNIKLNSANKWRGQNNTGTEGDTFSHFDTPEQGTRALVKVIGANLKATNSYETYVNRYASEPKEKAYYKEHGELMPHLANYAKTLMKSQGATDIKAKPSNVDMTEWVKATIKAEGGKESLAYFTDKIINEGIALA